MYAKNTNNVFSFTGQWQTYPLPQNSPLITPQPPQPNTNHVLPQNPKSMPSYFTQPPLPSNSTINTNIQQLSTTTIPSSAQSTTINIPHNPHISTLGSFAGLSNPSNSMLSTHTPHTQVSREILHFLNSKSF